LGGNPNTTFRCLAWRLPATVAIGANVEGVGASVGVSIIVTLLVTLIPVVMNAIIYAYVWATTQSLAVSSAYHSAYDEVRDAIEQSIGFGLLVSIWEMLATTLIGAVLLWEGNWKPLARRGINLSPEVESTRMSRIDE